MKKRNPWLVALFSFITGGIYNFYWLYKTSKELQQKTQAHIPSLWWLTAPCIAGILTIIGYFTLNQEVSIVLFIAISTLFAIGWLCIGTWWFYRFCHVAAIVGGYLKWSDSYLIWIITHITGYNFIWIGIAQYDLNKQKDIQISQQ